ncbi:non-homologous end-joining DNA ligase [Luedemannella flava]|uniref:non-homologous end-joining DNA ligase n=1 Tax=Luedemannella flava TaxID=349316 RepID=UPI0031DC16D3
MPGERVLVHVDGRELELSNLDKVLYPRTGWTKGEMIDYYVRVAPVLLRYLRGRPLTRIRHPNGVAEQGFFEKNAPAGTPDWVRTVTLPVPGSTRLRETIDYVVVEDVATLVWLANLAAIELHTPQWRVSRAGKPAAPDLLVADLDPGPGVGLAECALVAVAARERFALDGLAAAPKTSGRKGMQLVCRLPGRDTSDQISEYAKTVAEDLERALPELVVSRMARNLRAGKVFFDWSQNAAAKTTVAAYSLRAGDVPTVSAPLSWAEVESGRLAPLGPDEVLARVAADGDLLAA